LGEPAPRTAMVKSSLPLALAALLFGGATAVDRHKFRTCAMTGFCKRHRHKQPSGSYRVAPASVQGAAGDGAITATLEGGAVPLQLEVTILGTGIARARITDPAKPRWEVPDVIEPLAAAKRTLIGDCAYLSGAPGLCVGFGPSQSSVLVLSYSPFKLDLYVDGEHAISANSRNLFHFEHHRSPGESTRQLQESVQSAKADDSGKKIVDYDEHGRAIYEDGTTSKDEHEEAGDGEEEPPPPPPPADSDCEDCWVETFQSHTDSKPLGPASVGMDLNFPGAANVYGIPEHAADMALKPTTGSGDWAEPYRMYTLDVFEYDLDVPMALYGDIPLMLAHNTKRTVGAFWHNPSETFIDVRGSIGPLPAGCGPCVDACACLPSCLFVPAQKLGSVPVRRSACLYGAPLHRLDRPAGRRSRHTGSARVASWT
jgi:alpha 1,3-glucosidase